MDKDSIDLMRAMGATKIQIFFHVKFPTALPQFFSGLKISASYAVVGAVISEWLGIEGLGVYMTRVSKAYAFDKNVCSYYFYCHYQSSFNGSGQSHQNTLSAVGESGEKGSFGIKKDIFGYLKYLY